MGKYTKMTLIDRVLTNIKERRTKLLNGGINSIPSPFKRFSEDFLGIEQGKYYIVTGSTKSAKTQLASYLFVYNTLIYAYKNPDKIKIKIFYYPLEETPEEIMMRFMSHLLYILSGCKLKVSPTDLQSSRNDKILSKDIIDLLESEEYKEILQFFEDNVIFSNSTNPTGVYNECKKYAETHGIVHKKKQTIKGELGENKEIDVFDWYEQNDPNEYRLIIYDHVSLTTTERGLTLKQSIDKLSEYFVILRNRYKFSPVVIQQQSFENESLDNFKLNRLRPTVAGAADSKYTMRDSNIVLGIFSPFKWELKEYFGYDISTLKDNCRFVEVLLNRGGSPGGVIGLFFEGRTNYFHELPKADSPEIQRVYNTLKIERDNTNKLFLGYGINKLSKRLQNKFKLSIFATLFVFKNNKK